MPQIEVNDIPETPYDAGYKAYCHGLGRQRNPYTKSLAPAEWKDWDDGWDAANDGSQATFERECG